jgi:hypothetical protein
MLVELLAQPRPRVLAFFRISNEFPVSLDIVKSDVSLPNYLFVDARAFP